MSHTSSTQDLTSAETRSPDARRAYVAAGIGWGLDGLTWTLYGFALTTVMPLLGITSRTAGWITAASIVASAFGGAIAGSLADRFGRVRVLTWVILGYCLFTGLTATSQNVEQFVVWRILEGIAFGAEWAVGAALVAEYAPVAKRSRILSAIHSCYAIGWAVSTGLYLWLFSAFDPTVSWRYLFLVGIIPGLVAFWIRLKVKDRVPVDRTRTVATDAEHNRFPLLQLFSPAQRRITTLAVLLGVGAQGIYYSVFVFLPLFLRDERGLSVVGTATYTWVVIAGSFLGYFLSGHIHDAIGRRPAFSLFFLAAAASIALFVLTPAASPGLAYPICFALGFFASGQAGGLGAFLAELFPTRMRASGQGLAYNAGRAIAAFGPLSVGVFAQTIGLGNAILIVGATGAAIGFIAVALLPETRGRDILATDSPTAGTATAEGSSAT
jgi:MFS family permease